MVRDVRRFLAAVTPEGIVASVGLGFNPDVELSYDTAPASLVRLLLRSTAPSTSGSEDRLDILVTQ